MALALVLLSGAVAQGADGAEALGGAQPPAAAVVEASEGAPGMTLPDAGAPSLGLAPPAEVTPEVPNDLAVTPELGLASWYGSRFHRRRTASGELFDMHAMTAAHRTLAFGTLICVRSQVTGRSVVVRVNDRGPHLPGRIVDLSRAAAVALGLHGLGLKPVAVTPLSDGATTCPDEAPASSVDPVETPR